MIEESAENDHRIDLDTDERVSTSTHKWECMMRCRGALRALDGVDLYEKLLDTTVSLSFGLWSFYILS